jgi:formylglycine-generating enzyme required for sulfatase activity
VRFQKKAKLNLTEVLLPDCTDGYALTSPVEAFKPDKLGLHDMAGNLIQWCEDWFEKAQKTKTQRGSSWLHAGKGNLSSSGRFNCPPAETNFMTGFRVVLELTPHSARS